MHLQQPKWKSHQNTNIKRVVTCNQVKTTWTLKYNNKNDKKKYGGLILGLHDQFQNLSWGFDDQMTDNIQIEHIKILTYFHPEWFRYWLLPPGLMYDLLYLIQK